MKYRHSFSGDNVSIDLSNIQTFPLAPLTYSELSLNTLLNGLPDIWHTHTDVPLRVNCNIFGPCLTFHLKYKKFNLVKQHFHHPQV